MCFAEVLTPWPHCYHQLLCIEGFQQAVALKKSSYGAVVEYFDTVVHEQVGYQNSAANIVVDSYCEKVAFGLHGIGMAEVAAGMGGVVEAAYFASAGLAMETCDVWVKACSASADQVMGIDYVAWETAVLATVPQEKVIDADKGTVSSACSENQPCGLQSQACASVNFYCFDFH